MSRKDSLLAILNSNNNDPFILFALAMEFDKLGKNNISIEYFKRLIKVHPNHLAGYYNYGVVSKNNGAYNDAQSIWTIGLKKAKQQNDFHYIKLFLAAIK